MSLANSLHASSYCSECNERFDRNKDVNNTAFNLTSPEIELQPDPTF